MMICSESGSEFWWYDVWIKEGFQSLSAFPWKQAFTEVYWRRYVKGAVT